MDVTPFDNMLNFPRHNSLPISEADTMMMTMINKTPEGIGKVQDLRHPATLMPSPQVVKVRSKKAAANGACGNAKPETIK